MSHFSLSVEFIEHSAGKTTEKIGPLAGYLDQGKGYSAGKTTETRGLPGYLDQEEEQSMPNNYGRHELAYIKDEQRYLLIFLLTAAMPIRI